MLVLVTSISVIYAGCSKDDDDPAPANPAPVTPALNAMSDPQINFTLDGVTHNWKMDNQPYYMSLFTTITGTTTQTGYYSCFFKSAASPNLMWVFKRNGHTFTDPCDSTQFMSFFPEQVIPITNSGVNSISMQYDDDSLDVWRPVVTDTTNVFKIEDTYYYQDNGVHYVRLYATFSCSVAPPGTGTPVKHMSGNVVMEMKNDH